MVIQATEDDRRSTLIAVADQVHLSRESVRRLRNQNGYHYYQCAPMPRLTETAKERRLAFAQAQIANHDALPVIFTDESMVAQDLNLGAI
jgi:hypothetical protein